MQRERHHAQNVKCAISPRNWNIATQHTFQQTAHTSFTWTMALIPPTLLIVEFPKFSTVALRKRDRPYNYATHEIDSSISFQCLSTLIVDVVSGKIEQICIMQSADFLKSQDFKVAPVKY